MNFVVNDTNIFFDLINVGLLDDFFQLELTVYTTDFIILEIKEPEQAEMVNKFIEDKRLLIGTLNIYDIEKIYSLLETHKGLSPEDCSVWYFSKQNHYSLITGDGLLRKCASQDGVDVKGILFILDELVSTKLIRPNTAAVKLELLIKTGCRLPQRECEERLKKWRI
jgi:predicted nucleic acid-binding protein